MLSKRTFIAFAVSLLATPALAQASSAPDPSAQAPSAPPASGHPHVKLHTAQGDIVLELYADKAPITVRNFLHYVDTKRMDGATFYRSSTPPGDTSFDYGILQGGVGTDPKKLYPPIAHESTAKTGLSHTDGTISMTRYAPGTATANFSICVGDQTYLDADPKDPKGKPGYAAFGRVVQGMDVVKKMLALPRDPNKGEGVMKGEMLRKPVPILTARRVAWAPPAAAPAAAASPAAAAPSATPQ